nr:Rha family transcriptional regulator [uncultured Pseudomonas sp.]
MYQHTETSNSEHVATRLPIAQNVSRTVTMSSLDLVGFINSMRGDAEAELQHKDFLAKVPRVLGRDQSAKFSADYLDTRNRQQKCYRFPKRESCLMAMSYSYELQAAVFDHMTKLEEALRPEPPPSNSKIIGELAVMECYTRLLKPAPSSQAMMLARISSNNGLDATFLPAYAVDEAQGSLTGSSMPTKALSALLREHAINLSASAFNQLLKAHGYLKRMTRKNSKQEQVEFWSVTDLGLAFGKNLTSPSNPRETQPHWYTERFAELVQRVGGAK